MTMTETHLPNTPAQIIASIPEKFEQAKESGDLFFFPSEIHKYEETGIEFEIRLCPALLKKPHLPTPHFNAQVDGEKAKTVKKFDPFCPPYNPMLLVGELKDEDEGAEYVVLFNKFSVVPHHFLLVTKTFTSQTGPLLPPDLVQAYKLLLAARSAGRKFFAFYNCGDLSGASQPHKHIQLIPLDPEDDGPPIEKLARKAQVEVAEKPFAIDSLPYANHIRRLPSHLSLSTSDDELSMQLSRSFMNLLDLVISTVRHDPTYPIGPPSYNFIMTLEHMHLIPRKMEIHVLEETKEEISVNALGFAGMLLVKCDTELEAVKKEGVGKILRGVGVESAHDFQVNSCSS